MWKPKRPEAQEQEALAALEVVAALESLDALKSRFDALTAKLDDLDRRLCVQSLASKRSSLSGIRSRLDLTDLIGCGISSLARSW